MYLVLFESEHCHGWHTTFYVKCHSCHQLFDEFPSSKPMFPDVDGFVNLKLHGKYMNEVTMRSVLTVHCSRFKIEDVVKLAAEEPMLEAADDIH